MAKYCHHSFAVFLIYINGDLNYIAAHKWIKESSQKQLNVGTIVLLFLIQIAWKHLN